VSVEAILRCVRIAVDQRGTWTPPSEYLAEHVSETVTNIVLSHR
jgi:hypothetical protein